jgi:hypothetical protein
VTHNKDAQRNIILVCASISFEFTAKRLRRIKYKPMHMTETVPGSCNVAKDDIFSTAFEDASRNANKSDAKSPQWKISNGIPQIVSKP